MTAAISLRVPAVVCWSMSQAVWQHEQPELLDLRPRVGDVVLDGLLFGQSSDALGGAAQRPLAHHVEGPMAQPDGAHGVVHPPAAESGLGHREAPALLAEQRVGRQPHVVVVHERVVPVA